MAMNTSGQCAKSGVRTISKSQTSASADRHDDMLQGFEGYRAFTMNAGATLSKSTTTKNHIIVVLDGAVKFRMSGKPGYLTSGDMVFVAYNQDFRLQCDREAQVLLYTFAAFSARVSEYLTQLFRSNTDYDGRLTPVMHQPEILAACNAYTFRLAREGYMSNWLAKQRAQEAFYIMTQTCDKSDILAFFNRFACAESTFRNVMLKYCNEESAIEELIARSGMCRTNFYREFRREFGMTVHRWIQLQRAKNVREQAQQPGITVKELMQNGRFSSASNFIRFCRLYFGCTPNELIHQARSGMPVPEVRLQ